MTVAVRNRQRKYQANLPALRRLANQAAQIIGNSQAEISIVLVNDAEMAKLNDQYHHVTGATDILTFDYGATGELIISVDHAVAQARESASRELALYIVHGLLHLAGYDDVTPIKRKRMRAAERRVANQLNFGRLLWRRKRN
jgi:probable rRNA maturation factor